MLGLRHAAVQPTTSVTRVLYYLLEQMTGKTIRYQGDMVSVVDGVSIYRLAFITTKSPRYRNVTYRRTSFAYTLPHPNETHSYNTLQIRIMYIYYIAYI